MPVASAVRFGYAELVTSTAETARTRVKTIRAQRSQQALIALLGTIGIFQLLFVSFALGYWVGPSRLPAQEVFIGITTAIVLGILVSALLGRRRQLSGAQWHGFLKEGARRRAVALFDDYVTIDKEIIVPATVERAALDGESLQLRYVDPVAEGPVLRELSGRRADLKRLTDVLQASSPAPEAVAR
ncbi:MAG: hypothetical protein AAFV29_15535 [Myxococcota bacterium]